jgi:hypothetical protein
MMIEALCDSDRSGALGIQPGETRQAAGHGHMMLSGCTVGFRVEGSRFCFRLGTGLRVAASIVWECSQIGTKAQHLAKHATYTGKGGPGGGGRKQALT